MKKTVLRSYAKLIAACGVNIQKGQEVFIQAELDQPEFVTMLVEECYKLKAKKVVVDWSHQPIDKLHVRYRSLTTMSKLDNYEQARWQHYVDTIPCRIYLISEDPDGLKGVNQEKMAKAQQKKYPIIKGYRDQIENKYQWCIAAVPGEKWAKKLFPNLRASQAVEKLWEAILATSRVTEDPIAAWQAHNQDLHDRCAYLNSLHEKKTLDVAADDEPEPVENHYGKAGGIAWRCSDTDGSGTAGANLMTSSIAASVACGPSSSKDCCHGFSGSG